MTRRHGTFIGLFADRNEAAYRTLGVSEHASDAEIEQAYLGLIAQYHSDRLVGLAVPLRRQAEKKARAIDIAYDRIKMLRQRLAYRRPAYQSSYSARVAPQARGATGALLWATLIALVALIAAIGLVTLRDRLKWASPQARTPSPGAIVETNPPSLAVAAPPAPVVPVSAVPAPVEAATSDTVPVERLVALMPKDPPPAPSVSPALSGEAALVEALRAGQIRPANGGDLARWMLRWSQANRRGVSARFRERSASQSAYVIQKDFTIPEGLSGAHAVMFLLDTRTPYPRGNPGHSVVLDMSTGACMGVTCSMLLD